MEEFNRRARREARRKQFIANRNRSLDGLDSNPSLTPVDVDHPFPMTMARRRPETNPLVLIILVVFVLALVIAVSAILWNITHPKVQAKSEDPSLIAVNTPVPDVFSLVPAATGKMTILLMGSDKREDDNGYRTDVILLVRVDADNMKVSVVSFPRDLWVKVPDMYEMKINQVQGLGGFEATQAMFHENFGVRPDYYILTNFYGFTEIINTLKGIDVTVAQTLTDDCDLPQAVDGDCTVEPGVVYMDGDTALWYVRSRQTSSDFDRLRRAQEVLSAAFQKMIQINGLLRLPKLFLVFSDNVSSNLKLKTIESLLPVANQVYRDRSRVSLFAITEEQATPSWSWNGMWILLPDEEAIHNLLKEAGY
jgi:LCP family protein required for cell wall assembly